MKEILGSLSRKGKNKGNISGIFTSSGICRNTQAEEECVSSLFIFRVKPERFTS